MKKFSIALHYQILIALILGSIFGAFFNVNQNLIIIEHSDEKQSKIENWHKIEILAISKNDTVSNIFSTQDQVSLLKHYSKMKKQKYVVSLTEFDTQERVIQHLQEISKIKKPSTIATEIKPIGDLFIRLLSFLAIPLVIASLIVGAASLDDIKKIGRIGGKTITVYILTTALAITIGVTAANLIQPGTKVNESAKERLMAAYGDEGPEISTDDVEINIVNFIVNIVPRNPINAIASGNMLQIVFFAVIFGIMLTFIERKKYEVVYNFFSGISDTMIKMVGYIMKLAPYGVFALIAATTAEFGYEILSTLTWYVFVVVLGLLLQTVIIYGSMVKFLAKRSPLEFFKGIRNAQAIAFSTSSSAATLPITMDNVERNLGVRKQVSGFVLPLGATLNMDGTALYQGVAAIFIAQVFGIDLTITAQLTIIITAVLASIGTAPVPGVGIIMLVMILQSVNIPPEGIAMILGIDRILDMARTVTNISGDSAVAVYVDATEK